MDLKGWRDAHFLLLMLILKIALRMSLSLAVEIFVLKTYIEFLHTG